MLIRNPLRLSARERVGGAALPVFHENYIAVGQGLLLILRLFYLHHANIAGSYAVEAELRTVAVVHFQNNIDCALAFTDGQRRAHVFRFKAQKAWQKQLFFWNFLFQQAQGTKTLFLGGQHMRF